MRKIIFILSILVLAACNSRKAGTSGSNAKYTIENVGNMNAEEIARNFPDSNLEEGEDMFEEGTEKRAYTILYPDTEDELIITWDQENRENVHSIKFTSKGKWSTSTGVDIGTTLAELNKLNGKPVSFYGFGWDYSGAVDWNGGKLAKSGVAVFLKSDEQVPNKFNSDKIIDPSEEELEAMDLKVGSIMIVYGV